MSPVSTAGTATADDIRRAALRLFADEGYEATSMREIAAAVGIKAGSLYNHFSSKEEILWELAQGALNDLCDRIDERLGELPDTASPTAQLDAFIEAHVRFHATNNEQARLVNRQMAGLSKKHYRELVALRDSVEERLEAVLERGVKDGSFSLVDSKLTSYAILQMCIAVSVWYRRNGGLGVDEISQTYSTLAQRMVSGDKPSARKPAAKKSRARS